MGFDHPRCWQLLTAHYVLLSALLLVITACMTWQPVAVASTAGSLPSGHLRVTTKAGAVHDLRRAGVVGDSITGFARQDSTYTAIAISDVTRVERARVARDRTMMLIGGIALAAFVVINNALSDLGEGSGTGSPRFPGP